MATSTKTDRVDESSQHVRLGEASVNLPVSLALWVGSREPDSISNLNALWASVADHAVWSAGEVAWIPDTEKQIFEGARQAVLTSLRMRPSHEIYVGDLPTRIGPGVDSILAQIPAPELNALLSAIRDWVNHNDAVRRIDVSVELEPDSPDWSEVVFEFKVSADERTALALWDSLASSIFDAKAALTPSLRAYVNRHVGFHVDWREHDA